MAGKVKAKVIDWKGDKAEALLKKKGIIVITRIAKIVKANIRREVPVKEGVLRDATVIGDIAEVGNKLGVNVGTDEDKAPYAPHVYWPGITRKYAGNDWITRALERTHRRLGINVSKAYENDFKNLNKEL